MKMEFIKKNYHKMYSLFMFLHINNKEECNIFNSNHILASLRII